MSKSHNYDEAFPPLTTDSCPPGPTTFAICNALEKFQQRAFYLKKAKEEKKRKKRLADQEKDRKKRLADEEKENREYKDWYEKKMSDDFGPEWRELFKMFNVTQNYYYSMILSDELIADEIFEKTISQRARRDNEIHEVNYRNSNSHKVLCQRAELRKTTYFSKLKNIINNKGPDQNKWD